jgi:nucleoid DNA-binding protein
MLQLFDELVKKTGEQLEIPEKIIEDVVMWVYKDAKEQTKNVKEIEISGMGKFLLSPFKTQKRLKRLLHIKEELMGREGIEKKLATIETLEKFYSERV